MSRLITFEITEADFQLAGRTPTDDAPMEIEFEISEKSAWDYAPPREIIQIALHHYLHQATGTDDCAQHPRARLRVWIPDWVGRALIPERFTQQCGGCSPATHRQRL
jgi:hypothetical protein